jgi:hypothetical protein
MNKGIITIVCSLFMSVQVFAQQTKPKFSPLQIPSALQDDVWSIEFAPMFWTQNAAAPKANNFSFSAGLNYHYEFNFSEAKRFSIAIGMGYAYTSLNHSGLFVNDTLNETHWIRTSTNKEISYSRLNLHRINLPVEFRVKLKSEFKFYVGYQSSILISTKNKSKIDGDEFSFTNFSNSATYQHGPKVRIGYKDIFIYGNYYLSSLFQRKSSISMQMIEIGISIGG